MPSRHEKGVHLAPPIPFPAAVAASSSSSSSSSATKQQKHPASRSPSPLASSELLPPPSAMPASTTPTAVELRPASFSTSSSVFGVGNATAAAKSSSAASSGFFMVGDGDGLQTPPSDTRSSNSHGREIAPDILSQAMSDRERAATSTPTNKREGVHQQQQQKRRKQSDTAKRKNTNKEGGKSPAHVVQGVELLERPGDYALGGRSIVPAFLLPLCDWLYFDQRLPRDTFHHRVRKIGIAASFMASPFWILWWIWWLVLALQQTGDSKTQRNGRIALFIGSSVLVFFSLFIFLPVFVAYKITKGIPASWMAAGNATSAILFCCCCGVPSFANCGTVTAIALNTFILLMCPRQWYAMLASSLLYLLSAFRGAHASCEAKALALNVSLAEAGCHTNLVVGGSVADTTTAELWIFFVTSIAFATAIVLGFYAIAAENVRLNVVVKNLAPTVELLVKYMPKAESKIMSWAGVLQLLTDVEQHTAEADDDSSDDDDDGSKDQNDKDVSNLLTRSNSRSSGSANSNEALPMAFTAESRNTSGAFGDSGENVFSGGGQDREKKQQQQQDEPQQELSRETFGEEEEEEEGGEPSGANRKSRWQRLLLFRRKKYSFLNSLRSIAGSLDAATRFLPRESILDLVLPAAAAASNGENTEDEHHHNHHQRRQQDQQHQLKYSEGICLQIQIVNYITCLEEEEEMKRQIRQGARKSAAAAVAEEEEAGEGITFLLVRLISIVESFGGVAVGCPGADGEATFIFHANDGPTCAIVCVCALRLLLATSLESARMRAVWKQQQKEATQPSSSLSSSAVSPRCSTNITGSEEVSLSSWTQQDKDASHEDGGGGLIQVTLPDGTPSWPSLHSTSSATAKSSASAPSLPPFSPYRIRIGAHRGQVILGTCGSAETHLSPVAIGDAVFGAKLCCAANRIFGRSAIIISDDVMQAADDSLSYAISAESDVSLVFSRRSLGFLECSDPELFCGTPSTHHPGSRRGVFGGGPEAEEEEGAAAAAEAARGSGSLGSTSFSATGFAAQPLGGPAGGGGGMHSSDSFSGENAGSSTTSFPTTPRLYSNDTADGGVGGGLGRQRTWPFGNIFQLLAIQPSRAAAQAAQMRSVMSASTVSLGGMSIRSWDSQSLTKAAMGSSSSSNNSPAFGSGSNRLFFVELAGAPRTPPAAKDPQGLATGIADPRVFAQGLFTPQESPSDSSNLVRGAFFTSSSSNSQNLTREEKEGEETVRRVEKNGQRMTMMMSNSNQGSSSSGNNDNKNNGEDVAAAFTQSNEMPHCVDGVMRMNSGSIGSDGGSSSNESDLSDRPPLRRPTFGTASDEETFPLDASGRTEPPNKKGSGGGDSCSNSSSGGSSSPLQHNDSVVLWQAPDKDLESAAAMAAEAAAKEPVPSSVRDSHRTNKEVGSGNNDSGDIESGAFPREGSEVLWQAPEKGSDAAAAVADDAAMAPLPSSLTGTHAPSAPSSGVLTRPGSPSAGGGAWDSLGSDNSSGANIRLLSGQVLTATDFGSSTAAVGAAGRERPTRSPLSMRAADDSFNSAAGGGAGPPMITLLKDSRNSNSLSTNSDSFIPMISASSGTAAMDESIAEYRKLLRRHPVTQKLQAELRRLSREALLDINGVDLLAAFEQGGALLRRGNVDGAAQVFHDGIAPLDPVIPAANMTVTAATIAAHAAMQPAAEAAAASLSDSPSVSPTSSPTKHAAMTTSPGSSGSLTKVFPSTPPSSQATRDPSSPVKHAVVTAAAGANELMVAQGITREGLQQELIRVVETLTSSVREGRDTVKPVAPFVDHRGTIVFPPLLLSEDEDCVM